jgi:hypothetical protein
MESIQENAKLREQIQRCASNAFNAQANHMMLVNVQVIMAQRSYLAYLIDRDLLKDIPAAIEQFKSLNELIKQHLSL